MSGNADQSEHETCQPQITNSEVQRMHRNKSGILVAVFVLSILSITNARGSELPDVKPSNERQPRILTESTWKFQQIAERAISVCWDKGPNPPDQSEMFSRQIVQAQAVETWGKYAGIKFVGWAPCKFGERGVRLRFHTKIGPTAFAIGKNLDGLANGIVFAYGPKNSWMSKCRSLADRLRQKNSDAMCTKWQATHMFGHVLGFVDVVPNHSGCTLTADYVAPDATTRSGQDAAVAEKAAQDALQKFERNDDTPKPGEPEITEIEKKKPGKLPVSDSIMNCVTATHINSDSIGLGGDDVSQLGTTYCVGAWRNFSSCAVDERTDKARN